MDFDGFKRFCSLLTNYHKCGVIRIGPIWEMKARFYMLKPLHWSDTNESQVIEINHNPLIIRTKILSRAGKNNSRKNTSVEYAGHPTVYLHISMPSYSNPSIFSEQGKNIYEFFMGWQTS